MYVCTDCMVGNMFRSAGICCSISILMHVSSHSSCAHSNTRLKHKMSYCSADASIMSTMEDRTLLGMSVLWMPSFISAMFL